MIFYKKTVNEWGKPSTNGERINEWSMSAYNKISVMLGFVLLQVLTPSGQEMHASDYLHIGEMTIVICDYKSEYPSRDLSGKIKWTKRERYGGQSAQEAVWKGQERRVSMSILRVSQRRL